MKNLFLLSTICLLVAATLSCKDKYHISGSATDGAIIDGSRIYVKQEENGKWNTLNSCEILHGRFEMQGTVDTTLLTALFIDEVPTLPLILEGGRICVNIDRQAIRITGTEHNDKLHQFILHKEVLERRLAELEQEKSSVMSQIEFTDTKLAILHDSITTVMQRFDEFIEDFIIDNHNTLLGPCVFRLLCSTLPYPMVTPQIERITSNAPEKFLNSLFVKAYMEVANKNSNKLTEDK